MENTLENKVRFFAKYIGSSFIALDCYTTLDHIRLDSESPFGWIDTLGQRIYTADGKLILNPFSLITDEDAIECGKILQVYPEDVLAWLNGESVHEDFQSAFTFQHVIDYLRSKGYALPYMNLSVEELINRGWVRLV